MPISQELLFALKIMYNHFLKTSSTETRYIKGEKTFNKKDILVIIKDLYDDFNNHNKELDKDMEETLKSIKIEMY